MAEVSALQLTDQERPQEVTLEDTISSVKTLVAAFFTAESMDFVMTMTGFPIKAPGSGPILPLGLRIF